MRSFGAILLAALTFGLATPAKAQDPLAHTAFLELQEICSADRGRLWGADLCGPLLVVDPATRMAWASQPDDGGILSVTDTGWIGELPADVTVANTSVNWAGTQWIMVVAPLPADGAERRVLLAHEAWHRVQNRLGLTAGPSTCAHLETERGRYLLRLEMRALATALRSRGAGRRNAAQDALFVRALRHAEFPEAAAQEAALDRNEGLAAYTGVRLGAGENTELFAARLLDRYDEHDAFARSYAYATGPGYGLLLDAERSNWRSRLGGYAPADMLREELRPPAFDEARLNEIAYRYGGGRIAGEEANRARERDALVGDARRRFAEGPRLVLPVANMQMEFDPERVTPIEGLGSIYATLSVRDAWGELRAAGGALISADFTRIVLPQPDASGLAGPGWSVSLVPGARVGGPDAQGIRRVTGP